MADTTTNTMTNQIPTSDGSTFKDSAAIAVALLAVTAFGVFLLFMLSRLDISESQWTRATYLLNGIEAIVFAAAGFLFGKEVHRSQAKAAETRAKDAEAKAEQKADEASKGRALAAAVLAKESLAQEPLRLKDTLGALDKAERAPQRHDVEEIINLARRLFPDV